MKVETHRAVRQLQECGRKWPDAWNVHNAFRVLCAKEANWPEYVFAPRQATRIVVMGTVPVDARITNDQIQAIALVGTLAAWRPTQGIYRFAPNLLDELWQTPVTGDLPGDLLHRLPEWCVYIEAERATSMAWVHGAWAKIGYDPEADEEELDLLIDVEPSGPLTARLLIVRLPLIGTLEESLAITRRDLENKSSDNPQRRAAIELQLSVMRELAEPIVSTVLYLCSANAEIAADGRPHSRTRPIPHKRGSGEERWRAAAFPTIWAAGTRLGAALQRARERAGAGVSIADAREVTPHIRRAHWHTYWVGALDSPDRRRELRWLPPIAVNLDDDAPPVATVRPVPDPGDAS